MRKVCIVGYGAIGNIHAQVLSKISCAELYAVCDINESALKLCNDKYKVKYYNDFDEMLLDSNVDTIHICTPHYLHFEMIKKALENNKKVVVEKPVTMTRDEFDELLNLNGVENVCVILQNRYNNCIVKLKQIISSGELGDIIGVKGFLTWYRDENYYKNSNWRGKWETEGGSVLINQALHTLDLLVYLAGDVKNVKANIFNYKLQDIIETEDTVNAYLNFSNDAAGLFYATNSYSVDSNPEVEIVGNKAVARYAYKKLFVNGVLVAEDSILSNGKSYWGSGHDTLFEDYYMKDKYFSPLDIKNLMYTLFGIYESAKNSGMEVII